MNNTNHLLITSNGGRQVVTIIEAGVPVSYTDERGLVIRTSGYILEGANGVPFTIEGGRVASLELAA